MPLQFPIIITVKFNGAKMDAWTCRHVDARAPSQVDAKENRARPKCPDL